MTFSHIKYAGFKQQANTLFVLLHSNRLCPTDVRIGTSSYKLTCDSRRKQRRLVFMRMLLILWEIPGIAPYNYFRLLFQLYFYQEFFCEACPGR